MLLDCSILGKIRWILKGNTILLLINSDTRDVSCLNSGLIMLDEHKICDCANLNVNIREVICYFSCALSSFSTDLEQTLSLHVSLLTL